jgi:hypothetical protein
MIISLYAGAMTLCDIHRHGQPAARTLNDAMVINAIFDSSFTSDPDVGVSSPQRAVWAAEDDRLSAPKLAPRRCCMHRRPVHGHSWRHR